MTRFLGFSAARQVARGASCHLNAGDLDRPAPREGKLHPLSSVRAALLPRRLRPLLVTICWVCLKNHSFASDPNFFGGLLILHGEAQSRPVKRIQIRNFYENFRTLKRYYGQAICACGEILARKYKLIHYAVRWLLCS